MILDTSDPEITFDPLVAITRNSTVTISGFFVEDTPFELQVAFDLDNDGILEPTDKIVLSGKTFATDTSFSIVATLSLGTNRILAKLTDKVDRTGTTEAFVLLDTVDPVLNVLDPIYPVGEVSARSGDPIVFQVDATDSAGGVASVVFFPPGAENPEELLLVNDIPEAVRDQWQVDATATHLLPVVVPAGVPAGPFSLNVRVTDNAGNFPSPDGNVIGTITAALQAFNIYLMPGANLVSTPLIPDVPTLATLMTQKVPNIDAPFKATQLEAVDTDSNAANDLDGDGDATLNNVVTKINFFPGGTAATAFTEFTPSPAADDLTTMEVGKGYWIFTDPDAFKESAPPATGLPPTPAPIKLTVFGTFLEPGTVPPIFSIVTNWNLVGLHSENPRQVQDFLAGRTFPTRVWTSLLEFLNLIEFDFDPEEGEERVTIIQGAFNSLNNTETGEPGRGFWLFSNADGNITP